MNRRNFLGLSSLLSVLPFCKTQASLVTTPQEVATKPLVKVPYAWPHAEIIPTGIKELDKVIGGIRKGHMITIAVATDWDVVSKYFALNLNTSIALVYHTHDGDRLTASAYCRELLGRNVTTLLLIDDARPGKIPQIPHISNHVAVMYLSDVYITCVDHLHQCVVTKDRYGTTIHDDGMIDNRYTYPTFKLEC